MLSKCMVTGNMNLASDSDLKPMEVLVLENFFCPTCFANPEQLLEDFMVDALNLLGSLKG